MRQRQFWWLGIFCMALLGVYIASHDLPGYMLVFHSWLYQGIPEEYQRITARCLSNVVPVLVGGLPLYVYWYTNDRSSMPLYGFSAKAIDLKPYFGILVLLIPLVVGASFTPDFQHAYPRYKFGFPEHTTGIERAALISAFELCYGLDFVLVEFLFRGFMVLAFVRLLGPRAIMPMVVVYAMIHFEKPLLEALSSIVGGFVLGVISYRTRSIYGGIILHLGIAFMMDIAGAFQSGNEAV